MKYLTLICYKIIKKINFLISGLLKIVFLLYFTLNSYKIKTQLKIFYLNTKKCTKEIW